MLPHNSIVGQEGRVVLLQMEN